MAAPAKKIEVSLQTKIPIGSGRAFYLGTALGGAEYVTGGVTFANETGARYAPPEKFDYVWIGGGVIAAAVTNLVKIFAETTVATSTETPLTEFKSAATLATPIPAGTPIMILGDQ